MRSSQSHQPFQLQQSLFEIIIDHHSIELTLGTQLLTSPQQSSLDRLLCIRATATDATLKFLEAGGRQKDLHSLGEAATHLPGSLKFDFQQNGTTFLQPLLHRSPWGSVTVAGELSPLQQPTCLHKGIEALPTVKEVTLPLALSLARRTRGGRYRQPDARMPRQEALYQRSFTDAARSGDHRESAHAV